MIYLAYILVIILLGIIGWRTMTDPKEGVRWIILASCLDFIGRLAAVKYVGHITVFHFVVLFFVLGWLIQFIKNPGFKVLKNPVFKIVLVFVLFSGISLFYTPAGSGAVVDFLRLAALFVVFFMVGSLEYSRQDIMELRKYIIGLGIACSIIAFFQMATGGLVFTLARVGVSKTACIPRAAGFFLDPNKFAVILMVGFLVLFSYLLENRKEKKAILSLVLIGSALVMTFSRSAWLGTFTGCIVVIMMGKRVFRKLIVFMAVCVITVMVLSSIPKVGVYVRHKLKVLVNIDESGDSKRLKMAKAGVDMFLNRPLGIGWRGFPVRYYEYIVKAIPAADRREGAGVHYVTESHSLPVTILAEFGIFGIIISVLLFLSIIRLMRYFKRTVDDKELRLLFTALAAIWWAFMAVFCFYSNIFENIFWIFFGLLISFGAMKVKKENDESPDIVAHVSQ